MPTVSEIRERAKLHEEELDSLKWFTVSQLAARWRLSESTVREIPASELRFKEFGNGQKRRRRYKPSWVEAYENAAAA